MVLVTNVGFTTNEVKSSLSMHRKKAWGLTPRGVTGILRRHATSIGFTHRTKYFSKTYVRNKILLDKKKLGGPRHTCRTKYFSEAYGRNKIPLDKKNIKWAWAYE